MRFDYVNKDYISHPKEYSQWLSIKRMSKDKNIYLYEEFRKFKYFLEYVGESPSVNHKLRRIDDDKGYEIGNMHWIVGNAKTWNRSEFRLSKYVHILESVKFDMLEKIGCPKLDDYLKESIKIIGKKIGIKDANSSNNSEDNT